MMEQKQKITKADAVSYCIIAYNSITTRVPKKNRTAEGYGCEMVSAMREYTPEQAMKKAEKILNDSNNK